MQHSSSSIIQVVIERGIALSAISHAVVVPKYPGTDQELQAREELCNGYA